MIRNCSSFIGSNIEAIKNRLSFNNSKVNKVKYSDLYSGQVGGPERRGTLADLRGHVLCRP